MLKKLSLKIIGVLLLFCLLLAMPTLALAEDNLAAVTPADGDEQTNAADPADKPEELLSDNTGDAAPANEPAVMPVSLPQSLKVLFYEPAQQKYAAATVTPVTLSLNGEYLPSDVPAVALSGRTLVPVRVISESLKAEVGWNKEDNTVSVTLGDQVIVLTIGSDVALVNGQSVAVPGNVSVSLLNYEGIDRTMVPLRFVTETLSAAVTYNAEVRNVDIIPPAGLPDDDDPDREPDEQPEPPKEVGVDENGQLYRRVVIDAGHGGTDPGTNGGGREEKELTLSVSLKVQRLLEDAGYEVIMSRTDDTYVSLTDRPALNQQYDAPVFVSIHCNAAEGIKTASGIETYAAPDDAKDAELADYLQKRLIAATNAKNRGVKTSRLVVLTHNLAPAALVEIGFMTNDAELAKITDEAYQQTLAQAICDGIEDYFAAN